MQTNNSKVEYNTWFASPEKILVHDIHFEVVGPLQVVDKSFQPIDKQQQDRSKHVPKL